MCVSDDVARERAYNPPWTYDKVAPGMVVTARVKPGGVETDSMTVRLECKSSVLSAAESRRWEDAMW